MLFCFLRVLHPSAVMEQEEDERFTPHVTSVQPGFDLLLLVD